MAAPLHVHQPEAADARSLSDRAYYRIRELIVSLALPPGSIVNERELMRASSGSAGRRCARRCGRSRRSSSSRSTRGAASSSPASTSATSPALSEVRLALESAGARLAAERAHGRGSRALRGAARRARARGRRRDERALIELDQRIHRHVYACAHNPFLARDARGVLRPDPAHLVPRARPRRTARGCGARAPRAARGDPRRRRDSGRGRHAPPRRGLRAGDPRRALTADRRADITH